MAKSVRPKAAKTHKQAKNKDAIRRPLALVVDDDETFVELVCMMIGEHFDVCVAYNGSDALRKFEQDCPDIVMTDIVMPRLDGFVLISEIRRLSDKPILAVSGGISESSSHILASLDAEFLGKNQIHDKLLKRLQSLLASYHERRAKSSSQKAC